MGITSLQVCMDSSDWLQGPNNCEDGMGMEDCSGMTSPTGDEMLTCSRPLIERRLRPQHEEAQKCPRCESTHTKFCYYNNYSLSQPRYFCKTCRRYWTKGGTLRNIPVGGGCRKNKKVSSKKPSSSSSDHPPSLHNLVHVSSSSPPSYDHNANPTALQLAFSDQLHFSSLHAAAGLYGANPYLLDQNPTPIDFMENKYEALLGAHDGFVGNGDGYGGMMAAPPQQNAGFHPFGLSSPIDHGTPGIIESCQRLMLPYHHDDNVDHQHHQQQHRFDQSNDVVEVKPNAKILSLEWHDHQQACNSNAGKDSFGYNFGGLGSWTGLMNGYGSSAANPSLV